jgi:hypothetical protein
MESDGVACIPCDRTTGAFCVNDPEHRRQRVLGRKA